MFAHNSGTKSIALIARYSAFFASNLLACILGSILRAFKKTLPSSFVSRMLLCTDLFTNIYPQFRMAGRSLIPFNICAICSRFFPELDWSK